VVPRQQLRESIRHLREELASGDPLSRDERERLERVLGEVSNVLAAEGAGESDEPDESEESWGGLDLDDLSSLVDRFEDTHPNLSVVLGRIADALSQLGI
jgi:hypothetical protein